MATDDDQLRALAGGTRPGLAITSWLTIPFALALIATLGLQAVASPAFGQTTVSGSIPTSTWTKEGSPYVLNDNTTISSGATLTINPGVIVESTDRYHLNVLGVLHAVGTAADPITISLGDGIVFYGDTS